MTFNYRYHRSRYKPVVVDILPNGFMKVSEYAKNEGLSEPTVRKRLFSGHLQSIKFNNVIYVKND